MSDSDPLINELSCPILMTWLEDPISLPCCGRAISREPLRTMFIQFNQTNCPCCQQDISYFNVISAAKSVNLAYMVEQAKQQQQQQVSVPDHDSSRCNHSWKAKIHLLTNPHISFQNNNNNNNTTTTTTIGRLRITNDHHVKFKTLLIPVVDTSGSMSGNPITQVQYSLNRIIDLSYSHESQLITHFIAYSDNAESHHVKTTLPISYYQNNIVARLNQYMGGTSFTSAFNEIVRVCKLHKDNQQITSVIVIFLTDGEDSHYNQKKRGALVKMLQQKMMNPDNVGLNKHLTIHTIGFGFQHDFEFLNQIRQIGTTEGAYRYANPSEDNDSLSNKINSILDVIVSSANIPIQITNIRPHDDSNNNTNINVLHQDGDQFWLNMTGCDVNHSYDVTVSVNKSDPITIVSEYAEDENDPVLWDQYYGHLIDNIASELVLLSNHNNNNNDNLNSQVHLELLQARSRSIIGIIQNQHTISTNENENTNTNANCVRLKTLIQTIDTLKNGGMVDARKLNDMKFEGKFTTKTNVSKKTTDEDVFKQTALISIQHHIQQHQYYPWTVIPRDYKKRCSKQIFTNTKNETACDWIKTHCDELNGMKCNYHDANALIVVSSLGKIALVKAILGTGIADIALTNRQGYNALDVAIIYGRYNTYDLLRAHDPDVRPTINGETLLRTCISKKHYKTADRLLNHKLVVITDQLINSAPDTNALEWLSGRVAKAISIENAIKKGMYDSVLNILLQKQDDDENSNKIGKMSWKHYMQILLKPRSEHMKIFDLLLQHQKLDANERFEIENEDEDEKNEEEHVISVCPLFIACSKGNMALFQLLIKFVPNVAYLNENQLLWIASCNNHLDIVLKLLELGADPNVTNSKKDGPLISCCNKGNEAVVELLMDAGAKVTVHHPERDNPVLICCRNGQYRVLETMLRHLSAEELHTQFTTFAKFDGFTPLMAAAEVNKIECVKICHKYGADLEIRTQESNSVLPGATALHLSCLNGRLAAVQTLCELGADIFAKTTVHGYTPLHVAIKNGHIQVVRYLLNKDKEHRNMKTKDKEERLPVYYAQIAGNEHIREEFFTSKLTNLLIKILTSSSTDIAAQERCVNTLIKYGESIGCHNYYQTTNMDFGEGMNLLSFASLMNGNQKLISLLYTICDVKKKDDYGLSPLFWMTFMGVTPPSLLLLLEAQAQAQCKEDSDVIIAIQRIKQVESSSFQNKLLITNIKTQGVCSNIIDQGPLNVIMKMTNGYLLAVNDTIVGQLQQSISDNHSLVGFLEKVKNNKLPVTLHSATTATTTNTTANTKQYLECVIKDAKIKLIKLIASDVNTTLQPIHMMALYLYSSNALIFEQVNVTLSKWATPEYEVFHPIVNCLFQGLSLLPNYNGEVYRALDIPFQADQYQIGTNIVWNTFAVCSKQSSSSCDLINQHRGIVFIIQSRTGKDITLYSKHPVDEEVIFNPGTRFEVVKMYKPEIIVFGQRNIRAIESYQAEEKHMLKAQKKYASIIIELHEITF